MMAWLRWLVPLTLVAMLLPARTADAGCGDVGVGRIDWTEVTLDGAEKPKEARLHGAFAWEASEFWQTHPIGGTLLGYVHVACDGTSADCSERIAKLVEAAGTKALVYFSGRFYGLERPPQVFPEGHVAKESTGPSEFSLTGSPNNPQLGTTVLALPVNEAPGETEDPKAEEPPVDPPPVDSPAVDPKEQTPSSDDDNGCRLVPGRQADAGVLLAFLGLVLLLGLSTRRPT